MARKSLAAVLVILFFVLGAGISKMAIFAFSPAKSGPALDTDKRVIEVKRAESQVQIAKTLTQEGLITNAQWFIWLGKITRQWGSLKAGEYAVSPDMSPLKIFQVLTSGVSVSRPVTIREGENMFEIAAALQEAGLAIKERIIELCKDPKFIASLGFSDPPATLEGYLFPETYFFNRTTSPEEMIRQMVKKFSSIWGATEEAGAKALGLTRHQVVTLASIIEKETGAAGERPLVSSVFHNRLRKRMRLQSDPTTIYGMWERYNGNIRKSDLLEQNGYNTYAIPGLPIGPIGNPGKESIQAALNPAQSEYLFFVSHNDGTHQFSVTLTQHNSAVQKFQVDRRAREGKSWRDLKKQPSP